MATFTTSPGDICRPYKHVEINYFPEGATQTFKRGALLIIGGAGVENTVIEGADNAVAGIVGFAAEDATGVAGTKIGVYLAKPTAEFRGKCVVSDAVDFTDIGAPRAIQKHGSYATTHPGVWVVDTTDAGNDAVVITKYLPGPREIAPAEGDFENDVVFRFLPAVTIWGVAA